MKKLLIVLFLLYAQSVWATNYYCRDDASGGDGLSDATAFTLAEVNAKSDWVAGDDVYFKCDDTWTGETLNIDWSGVDAGNPAIVGAYYGSGTIGVSGTKPTIDGEYTYPTATWSHLIGIDTQSYITLTNIRVVNSLARAIWVDESSYIDVLNCDVNKAYRTGIGFGGPSNNCSAIGCTVTDVAWVYQVADWPAAIFCMNGCDSMTFSDNTVHNNWGEGIGLYYHTTNSLVENNFVYENRRVNIYNGSSRNNIIRYNLIFGHGSDSNGHGIMIDDEQWHNDAYSENVEIYGNFIAYCYVGFYFGTSHEDAVFKDHKIYSNTLVDNVRNMGFYGNKDAENSEIKDNIFYCITGGGCSNLSWTADSDIDFDYNLWSSEPDTNAKGANDLSYADPVILRTSGWRELGGENVVVTDFALQVGSPAINSAINLGSPYDIIVDAEGSTFPASVVAGDQDDYGSGWEIGADLYGVPPTLTNLTSTPVSCVTDPLNHDMVFSTILNVELKYDSSDVAFGSMGDTFTNTDDTSHSETLSSLSCGVTETQYVRGQDELGYTNESSTQVDIVVQGSPALPHEHSLTTGSTHSLTAGSTHSIGAQ